MLIYQTKQFPGVAPCRMKLIFNADYNVRFFCGFQILKGEENVTSYQDLTKTPEHPEKTEFNQNNPCKAALIGDFDCMYIL